MSYSQYSKEHMDGNLYTYVWKTLKHCFHCIKESTEIIISSACVDFFVGRFTVKINALSVTMKPHLC